MGKARETIHTASRRALVLDCCSLLPLQSWYLVLLARLVSIDVSNLLMDEMEKR